MAPCTQFFDKNGLKEICVSYYKRIKSGLKYLAKLEEIKDKGNFTLFTSSHSRVLQNSKKMRSTLQLVPLKCQVVTQVLGSCEDQLPHEMILTTEALV